MLPRGVIKLISSENLQGGGPTKSLLHVFLSSLHIFNQNVLINIFFWVLRKGDLQVWQNSGFGLTEKKMKNGLQNDPKVNFLNLSGNILH